MYVFEVCSDGMWKFNQTKEKCEREDLNQNSGAENDVTRERGFVCVLGVAWGFGLTTGRASDDL